MNTKKSKNKKPNKPPNPNPPQVENVKVVEVDDVKISEKVEERVPEIISDVVTHPVEVKEEIDTPKKPKRNRGKKKKQEKDDFEEQQETTMVIDDAKDSKDPIGTKECVVNVPVPETVTEGSILTPKDTIADVPQTVDPLVPDVTPTARKKKNKNKKNISQEQQEKENVERSDESKEILPIKTEDIVVEVLPEIAPKVMEDVKPSKKKNKKKKRHDSEKSDKVEEISCTAAFENILNVEDKNVGESKDSKKEIIDSNITVKDDIHTPIIIEEKADSIILEEENAKMEDTASKGNKNKKKNKKSRMEAKIEHEQELPPPPLSETKSETVSEIKTDEPINIETSLDISIDKKEESKIITENIILETPSVKEEEVKPKAKIAKPVDKKHKEKSQKASKESDPIDSLINISGVTTQEPEEKIEVEPDHQQKIEETKESTTKVEINPTEMPVKGESKDEAILSSLVELINMPSSSMGKKRKKSPKPQKDTNVVVLEEIWPNISCQENKESTEQVKESKDNVVKSTEGVPSDDKNIIMKPIQDEPTIQESVQQLESSTDKLQIVQKEEVETKHSLTVIDTKKDSSVNKPGKKRKKSPKPPLKLDATITEPEIKISETENIEEKKAFKETEEKVDESVSISVEFKQTSEKKTDEFYDLPHMEDIDIKSYKDESEGSTLEITPDSIQYPRANSQQADTNNNTLIQEIAVTDDVKLGIPIVIPDTPFIKEDTPLTSPELIMSGIRVTKSPEKTDIKSKMMEVNQDMEELRLSIERSLAELTSIEKSEQNVEKQYEEQILVKSEKDKIVDATTTDVALLPKESETKEILPKREHEKTENKNIPESQLTLLPEKAIPLPPPPLFSDAKKEETGKSLPDIGKSEPVTSSTIPVPPPMPTDIIRKEQEKRPKEQEIKPVEALKDAPPVCPTRKDNKGKGKSKKKGKQEAGQASSQITSQTESSSTATKESSQETKKEEKTEQKTDASKESTKQQSSVIEDNSERLSQDKEHGESLPDFEPIENFEDAMTSSVDDVNKTFEMIANDAQSMESQVNPEINITAPIEERKTDKKDERKNLVSQPKNLLGHPDIPVQSNKMDYKKEKNKSPNDILAKVKIKDSVQIEVNKQSKESQTDNIKKLMKKNSIDESFTTLNESDDYVYKYSFRKVFLTNVCHVCKKDLKQSRVACSFCNLLFYCSAKHKDEDWPQHQALCFAVSTIAHLKDQKHIYADAKNITGHNYRLLRMQMIVSCEKVLKRRLVPWEQEALLYPRICADVGCREWRQSKLTDCEGCGQLSYCSDHVDHLPKSHQRWCKSYSLYQKLVCYQQTRGRLEPKLPGRIMVGTYHVPEKINEVLASMYMEKIDMNDVEYAALTQLATAPLTALYSFQIYTSNMNSTYANGTFKKPSLSVHVVGAELQHEADALRKWETFLLHLQPAVRELTVSLIAPDLNPHNLPLDLLGKVKLCETCRQNKRRVQFSFQDKKTYAEYYRSDEFTSPDIVCTFNASIQRSSVYNGKDTWPATINCILKQKIPFVITSYTMEELCRDLGRVKECAEMEFNIISQPKYNPFASVRPDRNFISDDEMPLLFKNYCFAVVCGVF